ncbi:hypothetical protein BS17DRAFT_481936 [Gyrodon lividus]|nr:hypothetical protein BS17DRAFT_481936 [Gyrodon lividus]
MPLPPPTRSLRGSNLALSQTVNSIQVDLGSGSRKLSHRNKAGSKPPGVCVSLSDDTRGLKLSREPSEKPENWSENGVHYTNSVVSPLEDVELLYGNSQYLLPDGTLRARLEMSLAMVGECVTC